MDKVKVESDFCAGVLRVALRGEIDHHSAPEARAAIDRDLYFFRPPKMQLDLSGIEFMDSSGLGLILGRYTKMKEWDGKIVLLDPTPEIRKILKLAGVERLIPIARSEEKENGQPCGKAAAAPPARAEKTKI